MGFVAIRVHGKTFPHRRNLIDDYGLEYDFRKKDFKGAFSESSKRVNRLKEFCEKKRLCMEVDGEEVVSDKKKKEKKQQTLSKEDLEDIDEFNLSQWLPVLQQVMDEKGVGTMGEKTLAPVQEGLGFLQEDIDSKTTYSNEWDILSKDTKFHPLRPIQKQVLDKVQEAIDEGYENIIVECPVGSGKSAIAKTIPQNYASPAYIVTHLKGLQAQYLKEMPYMATIMGRGNYDCMLDIEPGTDDLKLANEALENIGTSSPGTCSASLAPCKFTKGFKCSKMNPVSAMGEWDFGVPPENLCDYFSSLTKAQNSMYFVGNTAYLMAMNQSGKILKERPFLIVDEAHQLANNMMSFYSLNISQRVLEKIFKAPSLKEIQSEKSEMKKKTLLKQREVITKIFDVKDASPCFGIPKIPSVSLQTTADERKAGLQILGRYLFALHEAIKKRIKDKDPHTKYDKRELGYANNFAMKIMGLLGSIAGSWENWVYQLDDKEEFPSWISFKPLDVSPYAEKLLLNLGQRRIFMSGTILDYEIFSKELGLKEENTCFIKVDYSPFKESNRPVFSSLKGGKLSRKEKGFDSFKKTADTIAEIAAKYPDQKGLILPFTDSIEAGVVEALQQHHPLVHARIRQHTKDPRERDSVFKEFEQEKNNEILISTYANQGFDGKMVGFTIIPKIPFGPLGDIQVKTKAENNPKWYALMAAVELAQMCGRCVRSDTDVGHTYIIDPSFWFHFERGFNYPLAKLLPAYLATTILRNRYKK
jgi:ATP-dependent DNA helicase DinG